MSGCVSWESSYSFIAETVVQHMLQERGYIYSSTHAGWYAVADEAFYPESGVHLIKDPRTGKTLMVREIPVEPQDSDEHVRKVIRNRHLEIRAPRWSEYRNRTISSVCSPSATIC